MSYFEDLLQTRTFAEWQDVVRTSAALVGWNVDGLPRRSRLRALMLQALPDVAVAANAAAAMAIKGNFRDLATGGWLKERARQVYNVEPFEETFCTVAVTLTNPDPIAYDVEARELIVRNTVTDETYYNLAPIHIDAAGGPQDEVTKDFIATNPGSVANADAGDIGAVVSPGSMTSVVVENEFAARASDEESEESIRERMRLALAQFSPAGPADAYAYIARSAIRLVDGTYSIARASEELPVGAASVGVTRVQVREDSPEVGDVAVYCADDDGPIAGPDATGIDGLILLLARPAGVNYLGTFPALAIVVPVTYTVTVRAADGFTTQEIEDMIEDALIALFGSPRDAPIGGIADNFYRVAIIEAIKAAQPSDAQPGDPRPIVDVPSLLPASDISIGPGQFPQLGAITPTVNFVS